MRTAGVRAAGGLVAGLAAAAVLAGCSNTPVAQPPAGHPSSTSSNPPSGPGSPSVPGPPGPSVPPGSQQGPRVPDSQLNVTGAPRAAPFAVWTSDGGRTLNIVAQRPACTRLWANVLDQNPSTVTIAMVRYALRTLQACPLHIEQFTVTAKLDAPLGNRRIVFVDTKG